MPITDTLGKEYYKDEETGEFYQSRWMNEVEIQERALLNIANTASAQRKRVIDYLTKGNGHTEYR